MSLHGGKRDRTEALHKVSAPNVPTSIRNKNYILFGRWTTMLNQYPDINLKISDPMFSCAMFVLYISTSTTRDRRSFAIILYSLYLAQYFIKDLLYKKIVFIYIFCMSRFFREVIFWRKNWLIYWFNKLNPQLRSFPLSNGERYQSNCRRCNPVRRLVNSLSDGTSARAETTSKASVYVSAVKNNPQSFWVYRYWNTNLKKHKKTAEIMLAEYEVNRWNQRRLPLL